MLFLLFVVSSMLLLIVAPLMTLTKYYKPSQMTVLKNIFWIIIGIITWPLIPYVLAHRNRDTLLITIFWASLIVFVVTFTMLIMQSVEAILRVEQQQLVM